jgi:hypothetical protein
MIVGGALAIVALAGCAAVLGYVLAAPIVTLGEVVFGPVEGFALRGGRFAIGEIGMTIAIDRGKGNAGESGGEKARQDQFTHSNVP